MKSIMRLISTIIFVLVIAYMLPIPDSVFLELLPFFVRANIAFLVGVIYFHILRKTEEV